MTRKKEWTFVKGVTDKGVFPVVKPFGLATTDQFGCFARFSPQSLDKSSFVTV